METAGQIMEFVKSGKSVLVTGGAGVGKSHILRDFIRMAKEEKLLIPISAMTGTASQQFEDGQTLHRTLGIGLSKDIHDLKKVIKSKKFNSDIRPIIDAMDGIIIDEISGMRSDLLGLIDSIFKVVKLNEKPFGGIPLILVGDFMQLGPIVKKDENIPKPWAFQAKEWKELNPEIIYLTKVYRQDNPVVQNDLGMIRAGICESDTEKRIRDTARNDVEDPVMLVSTNKEADLLNINHLMEIDEVDEVFKAELESYNGPEGSKHLDQLLKGTLMKENLQLRYGCRVMILVNGEGYVNGSLGYYRGKGLCTRFDPTTREMVEKDCLYIELDDGSEVEIIRNEIVKNQSRIEEVYDELTRGISKERINIPMASMTQFPVRIGKSYSIHKSQGQTIEKLCINFERFFAPGQAYVALSRMKSIEGLKCLNFNKRIVKADKDAFNFYMDLKNAGRI
ncbi:MAG: AAA family ATPase [Candidatus Njordarchaeales archaeon]